ncbi:MAG: hypothetical protein J6Y38_01520 [Bacteroidaceae bacterium]|nr:hypothetical protein [Bacteroidaceae bacterium]
MAIYTDEQTTHPKHRTPLLLVIGSDRRGTAFGLMSLSEAVGVSSEDVRRKLAMSSLNDNR